MGPDGQLLADGTAAAAAAAAAGVPGAEAGVVAGAPAPGPAGEEPSAKRPRTDGGEDDKNAAEKVGDCFCSFFNRQALGMQGGQAAASPGQHSRHLATLPACAPLLPSAPQARASLLGALDPAAAAQEAAAAQGLQQLPGYQPGAPMPMPFPGMTAGGAPPAAPGGP